MQNLEMMQLRMRTSNNDRQHERMIEDKRRSFHRALLYSYQAAWIKKDTEDAEWCRALINPDKVKFDYDEKIVSVDWKYNFGPGDSFEWPKESGQHWLILKQELTELAYFRGNVRRAQLLEAVDPETKETVSLWAAVRGPVETKLDTIQKHNIVADVPNLTLQIYVRNNEITQRTFARYQRFKFAGKFWKSVAPDWISTPGILEISAVEDYECHADDYEPIDPNPAVETPVITGEVFTKPLFAQIYSVSTIVEGAKWSVRLAADNNKEVDDVIDWKQIDDSTIEVIWTAMVSGSYVISYGEYEKIIVVESLF